MSGICPALAEAALHPTRKVYDINDQRKQYPKLLRGASKKKIKIYHLSVTRTVTEYLLKACLHIFLCDFWCQFCDTCYFHCQFMCNENCIKKCDKNCTKMVCENQLTFRKMSAHLRCPLVKVHYLLQLLSYIHTTIMHTYILTLFTACSNICQIFLKFCCFLPNCL